jgi:arsenate reductase (thioredoxin)
MSDPSTEPDETTEADETAETDETAGAPAPPQAPASPLVSRLTKILVYDYSDRFPAGQVIATFHDSYALLAKSARITAFLPTLAERFTRERLDAYAQANGMQAKRAPEILFVCVHNAGRSQMAAAFARYYGQNHVHIRTGGSDPGERIQPEVSHAMKEVGISLDEEFPKPLTNEVVAAADVVITMGCGDTCPFIPGRRSGRDRRRWRRDHPGRHRRSSAPTPRQHFPRLGLAPAHTPQTLNAHPCTW